MEAETTKLSLNLYFSVKCDLVTLCFIKKKLLIQPSLKNISFCAYLCTSQYINKAEQPYLQKEPGIKDKYKLILTA